MQKAVATPARRKDVYAQQKNSMRIAEKLCAFVFEK